MKYKAGYAPTRLWKAFLKYLDMNFCFGDWSSPPERRKPVRENWEYVEIYCSIKYFDELEYDRGIPHGLSCVIKGPADFSVQFGNPPDCPTDCPTDYLRVIVDTLNKAGRQGWEIISVRESIGESVILTIVDNVKEVDNVNKRPNVRTIYTLKREIKYY